MTYVLLCENDGQRAVDFAERGYKLVEKARPDTGMAVLYQSDYANIGFFFNWLPPRVSSHLERIAESEREKLREEWRTYTQYRYYQLHDGRPSLCRVR